MNLQALINLVKDNQILLTGLGLSGAGIVTFWLKDIPKTIISFLKRELTTTVVVTSQHKVFYELLKWIEIKYKNKNFRNLKISNGKWGEDNTVTSLGYGFHFIWYKRNFLYVSLTKESANQTDRDKETMSLIKIGRNKNLFHELLKEIETIDRKDKTKVYSYITGSNYWSYLKDQYKRSLDSVFIEKKEKQKILDTLDRFLSMEQWYINNGIPYQLGIILEGPPGTGKTSLIKAIAAYLNYPIYYLSVSSLSCIINAIARLEERSLLVLEDLDCNKSTHSREDKKISLTESNILDNSVTTTSTEISDPTDFSYQIIDPVYGIDNLSDILNSIDGIYSIHGRILIATTNHIEMLDSALLRPGRIDLTIHVGYVNNEILESFVNNFYPDNNINFNSLAIKEELTVAMLQNMVLQDYSVDQLISEVTIPTKGDK